MIDKDILLQLQSQLSQKLLALRQEEATWLKLFLLLYSALSAWLVARWLSDAVANHALQAFDGFLLSGALGLSWIALFVSSCHFLHLRSSYFRVGRMLVRCQEPLGLFNKEDGIFPWRIGVVKDWQSWRKTRILATFTTRIAYVAGANLVVTLLATAALGGRLLGLSSACVLLLVLLLYLALGGLVVWVDYQSLRRATEAEQRLLSQGAEATGNGSA